MPVSGDRQFFKDQKILRADDEEDRETRVDLTSKQF